MVVELYKVSLETVRNNYFKFILNAIKTNEFTAIMCEKNALLKHFYPPIACKSYSELFYSLCLRQCLRQSHNLLFQWNCQTIFPMALIELLFEILTNATKNWKQKCHGCVCTCLCPKNSQEVTRIERTQPNNYALLFTSFFSCFYLCKVFE